MLCSRGVGRQGLAYASRWLQGSSAQTRLVERPLCPGEGSERIDVPFAPVVHGCLDVPAGLESTILFT